MGREQRGEENRDWFFMKSGLGKILETLKLLQVEVKEVRRTPPKSDPKCVWIDALKNTKQVTRSKAMSMGIVLSKVKIRILDLLIGWCNWN